MPQMHFGTEVVGLHYLLTVSIYSATEKVSPSAENEERQGNTRERQERRS